MPEPYVTKWSGAQANLEVLVTLFAAHGPTGPDPFFPYQSGCRVPTYLVSVPPALVAAHHHLVYLSGSARSEGLVGAIRAGVDRQWACL